MLRNTGLILRRHPLTETSLIITWLTPDHGIQRTVARAALRRTSPFFGQLDLFFTSELAWVPSRSSDLHALREVRLLDARLPLRSSHRKLEVAAWFTHLILACTEPETPAPEQHLLLSRALDHLRDHAPQPRLLDRFEARLAWLLGLGQATAEAPALPRLAQLFPLQTKRRPVSL